MVIISWKNQQTLCDLWCMYLHNMLDVCWKLCFKWNAWLLYKMCIFSINTCTCIAIIIMRILEWISAFLLLLNLLFSLIFINVVSTCSSASNNIMLNCWIGVEKCNMYMLSLSVCLSNLANNWLFFSVLWQV